MDTDKQTLLVCYNLIRYWPWEVVVVRRLCMVLALALCCGAASAAVKVEQKKVRAAGKAFSVRVVSAPLDSYRMKVALAGGRVGATESLPAIAKRAGAAAAINGCFFDAYSKDPVKPPYHNIMIDGEIVHIGNTGTTLGFDASGNYRMDQAKFLIRGKNTGLKWYAYFVNHRGRAVMYTKRWVGSNAPSDGMQVVVRSGIVESIGGGPNSIPADGFVLCFGGGEAYQSGRLRTGGECTFRSEITASDSAFWSTCRDAIGCGPRLVRNGQVRVNPTAEGFSSYKILSMSGARSAIGVTHDRRVLFVTCTATVQQLGQVMKALGAVDAMNLDGGASAGLYANGRTLQTPGRLISNAVVLVKR